LSRLSNLKMYYLDHQSLKMLNQLGEANKWFVADTNLFPSYSQGYLICQGSSKEPVMAFYALPYKKKLGIKGIPVVRVLKPILFAGEWDRAMVSVLLNSIRTLKTEIGFSLAELEVYANIKTKIFFPSSETAVDSCNDPLLGALLAKEALKVVGKYKTVALREMSFGDISIRENGIKIRPINNSNRGDREAYYRLWAESDFFPLHLSRQQKVAWIDARPWYSDFCSLLDFDDFILFAEIEDVPAGFIHWWPNLYSMMPAIKKERAYVSRAMLQSIINATGEAKFFKLAVSRKWRSNYEIIIEALLKNALKIMKSRFNIGSVQVFYINNEKNLLADVLKEFNPADAHDTVIYLIE
jgi:hypothetical protein